MYKLTKNSFSGGRNSDINVADIQPNQYQAAHNIDIVANGNFFALENIKGTTGLAVLAEDDTTREIGSYPCKFSINGTLTYCIVYITMSSATGKFNIWTFDTENSVLYALYQESYANGYYTDDRVVDIINYPENGIDHIYFTDGFNELRHLICSITTPWVANSLTAFDLALQRRGANGAVTLSTIASGGSLLSGTYQFAYRMCNPSTKKFTKWSSITNPIHVYDSSNTSNPVYAGIGLPTTRGITVTVTPSATEVAAVATLPYVQLAVIENIGVTPAISVSLQSFVSFVGTSVNINYLSNTRVDSIPLDSFLIDDAQILNAKTLRSSNNRLFLGNVNYVDLEFNSSFGAPGISSGSIIKATSATIGGTQGDSYSSDLFSSKYIGHWRDEVYRYGAIYKDKYGNRSYVSPLDMSAVTGNQISGGLKDMKFPARSVSNAYTLFNSNGYMQGLGINLSLVNHPTWAVEMEIVRVPRKKNIQFQSPIIPMMVVNGIGALKNYPSTFTTATGNNVFNTSANMSSAQPMTAGKVMVPKNMFWPEGRNINKFSTDIPATFINNGEVYLDNGATSCTYSFSMLFPTANMYGDTTPIVNDLSNAFVYTGTEVIDFVDQALLKLNYQGFPPPSKSPYVIGEDINTNISGNFYAVLDGDYYYDSGWVAKPVPLPTYNGTAITSYQFYDNLSPTAPVAGTAVMDYAALQTTGYKFGFQPSIQRSAVVALSINGYLRDPTALGSSFANGVLNPIGSGGGFIVGSAGARYQTSSQLNSSYLPEGTSYNLPNNTYCTAVDIVNVKIGLTDNRYGDIDSLHLYQSTGATYTFSSAEQTALQAGSQVTVNLDIWGGDCFVAPHTFKICDSTYSVTNSRKPVGAQDSVATLNNKWGGYFLNGFAGAICLPVAVENAAQYITVVLESEYNGGVRDHDILTTATTSNGVPILNNSTKDTCRIPLSYRYNFNLSRSNYQKVFSTLLQFSFQQFHFGARVPYSNIKIYNSDQSGFDIFFISDFIDLPEQRYDITSLAVAADMLYAIQEKGIVYLPTSSRQIEETDATTLAVSSGVVIGRPIIISSERGSQHLRGIVETGSLVYIPDNKNKDIYALAGTDLKPITENNSTLMRTIFTTQLDGNDVKGVYDFVRNQFLLIIPSQIQVYNQDKGLWVGDYECIAQGGVYQRGLYLTGFQGGSGSLRINSLYTGTLNILFGNTVDPRIDIVVNPDEAFAKTFDVWMIDSSDKLSTADIQVIYDTSSSTSTISGLNLAIPNIENNYRLPLGKDQNGFRLRGMRMLATIHWGSLTAQLKSIFTKYRYSKRTPF